MADQPAKPVENEYDAYDIGEESSPGAVDTPAGESVPSTPQPLPRNPDGTFKPRSEASPRIQEMAKGLGVSDDEIQEMAPKALETLVLHLQKRDQALARVKEDRTRDVASAVSQPAPKTPPAPEPDEAIDIGIDQELFEPSLYNLLKSLHQRVQKLEGGLGNVTGFIQAKHNESLTRRCDRAFTKHKDLLGEGAFGDFKAESPELIRRQAVINLVKGWNGNLSDLEKNIDRAVEVLYGVKAGTSQEVPHGATAGEKSSRQSPQQDSWLEAGLARPTNRVSSTPEGKTKAEKTVAAWQREQSQTNGTAGGDDDDGFLP